MVPNPQTFTVAVETCSVSLLPVDHPERGHFSVTLQRRPGERWVIEHHRQYLDADGAWSYGPSLADEWRAAHWHTWNDANRLASEACRHIVVNGRSAEEVVGEGS